MLIEIKRLVYAIWSFVFYIRPTDSARMASWRDQDLAGMQDTPGIDVNAVGKLIGTGMQHRIYEYQADIKMVLKVTTPIPFLRFPTFHEAQEDVRYMAQFLAPYVVEPIEIVPMRAERYAIKQRSLDAFRVLTPTELQDEQVRREFLDLVARNQHMRREVGRSLDFLGREGQRKCRAALIGLPQTPTIANVVIELLPSGAKQIRALDTDLENFRPAADTVRDHMSALAARIAVAVNRFLIKHFFGIDIAPG